MTPAAPAQAPPQWERARAIAREVWGKVPRGRSAGDVLEQVCFVLEGGGSPLLSRMEREAVEATAKRIPEEP